MCPARVLLGGRCPKGCPRKQNIYHECERLNVLDHILVDALPSGEMYFVSRHHGVGWETAPEVQNLVSFCRWHGLSIKIEEQADNATYKTHIIIKKGKQ